jgi:hypothetical protein
MAYAYQLSELAIPVCETTAISSEGKGMHEYRGHGQGISHLREPLKNHAC